MIVSPAHAPSYYAATAVGASARPPLAGERTVDVCVIGAGYTGLAAALHLAKRGRSVAVVEAQRIGWGASGRNGGQLHSGQRLDQETLESWLGAGEARALFDLAEEAKRQVKATIRDEGLDCDWHDGLIHAIHKRRLIAAARRETAHLGERYGYDGITWLDRDDLAGAIGSDRYLCGWRDASAGHLHPLNFALGLARAAEAAGATIYEGTPALGIGEHHPRVVATAGGLIRAADVIVAVNGYGSGLAPAYEARVMPMNNYLVATEPLGDRLGALIPGGEAVADSRFVVHYWRPSGDGRLIFGGGETYSTAFPADMARFVRPHLVDVYPGLKDVRLDFAWGGTLALSLAKMPVMRRLAPGLYAAGGYTGHGVAIANLAGRLMAEAVLGDSARFDVFARIPARPFPGGRRMRFPLLLLAMFWYGLLDRL